jgi:hypothetical protein
MFFSSPWLLFRQAQPMDGRSARPIFRMVKSKEKRDGQAGLAGPAPWKKPFGRGLRLGMYELP